MISWRTATIVLALVCCIQRWQSCTQAPAVERVVEKAAPPARSGLLQAFVAAAPAHPAPHKKMFGFTPPAWASSLLPQPGEKLHAYRDRILPLAEIAVAPQRARVAKLRDQLAPAQRVALDAAVTETADAIETRIATAVLNGELQSFKPMTGVTMARELLDIVDRGNARFVGSLPSDQRAALAASRFDFADYLLFSTKWEDALDRN